MNIFANRFLNRVLHKTLWAVLLPLCLLWGVAQAVHQSAKTSTSAQGDASPVAAELPAHWNGATLRPLALSEVEHDEQPEAVAGQARQRCFIAERAGQRIRVCEHIEDAKGQTFTDTSAWYWAAVAGQSSGPWQAITVARPL